MAGQVAPSPPEKASDGAGLINFGNSRWPDCHSRSVQAGCAQLMPECSAKALAGRPNAGAFFVEISS